MTKQVTLENTLSGGFGLPTGQIVPGNGSIVVEPEVWAAAKDHPVVEGRVKAGTIIVDGQGKKSADTSADTTALQARVTELEALLKTANDEITTLKASSNGQGGSDNGGTTTTYTIKEQSAGWLAVVDADGKAVTKNLRKADLAEFEGMNDADKAAFIELNKAD